MNYIKHLTGFFDRAAKDHHLNCTHVSLYMAIFQLWNLNRFKNPISLSRSELMGLSKVSSQTIYHKCMKELQLHGYLRYDPSYHPLRGSWVYLFEFDSTGEESQSIICPGTEQVTDKLETAVEQAEYEPCPETLASKEIQGSLNIYKHSKHIKHSFLKKNKKGTKNENEKREILEDKNLGSVQPTNENKSFGNGKINSMPEIPFFVSKPGFEIIPETVETVIEFFVGSDYPKSQAIKFFHYFSATGWKVGGKAQIENWHAAAHSWMLNSGNSSTDGKSRRNEPVAARLHSKSDKNYSEPL